MNADSPDGRSLRSSVCNPVETRGSLDTVFASYRRLKSSIQTACVFMSGRTVQLFYYTFKSCR